MTTSANQPQPNQTPNKPHGQPVLRPWVTPTFAREKLKDALNGTFNLAAYDGNLYYS